MILAIDIGNTSISLGVFQQDKLLKKWRIHSDSEQTADEYALILLDLITWAKIKEEDIEGAIISSVVPPLTPIFQQVTRQLFSKRALVVGPGLKTGMAILYENPQEVGADRSTITAPFLFRSSIACSKRVTTWGSAVGRSV